MFFTGKNVFLRWAPAALFLGIIAVVLLGQYDLFGHNSASLKMTNMGTIGLKNIKVELHRETCKVARLNPGESSLCDFKIAADAHYVVSWAESESDDHQEQLGYVTPGFDFIHELQFLGAGNVAFKTRENIDAQ
jgi:hypothetical protein